MRARDAMEIWAHWWLNQRVRGWPAESIEARLMQHAGELVRASVPAGPRIPDIDRARLGPRIHRLLLDMDASGPHRAQQAQALRLCAIARNQFAVALELEVHVLTVKRRLKRGREWLDEQLRLIPLEQRREAA